MKNLPALAIICYLLLFTIFISSCKKDVNSIPVHSSFTDLRDNKLYTTVTLGNQTWMAENLNFETSDSWWPNNDSTLGNIYGRLYLWESSLIVCPEGWHLPTDEEWKTLEKILGMSQKSADSLSYRGTNQAIQLKSEKGWLNGYNGNNSSGFNALPGGVRFKSGTFTAIGMGAYWWTSTPYNEKDALYRNISIDIPRVNRFFSSKIEAKSVRCVKN